MQLELSPGDANPIDISASIASNENEDKLAWRVLKGDLYMMVGETTDIGSADTGSCQNLLI